LLGNDATKAEAPFSKKKSILLKGFNALNPEGQSTLLNMLAFLRHTHVAAV